MRLKKAGSCCLIHRFQDEIQTLLRLQTPQSVRPFNNGQAGAADILGQPGSFNILFPGQTVAVHMEKGKTARILVQQGKGRTGDILVFRYLQSLRDELGERCLADTQIAVQEDDIAFAGDTTELSAQAGGRCRIPERQAE